ncbi:131_t:CDS:2 [Diversispora eburnea]|uniref:131_t:CDS:1 n=1 Tax=Diversispora eburnea TaxID=1213867 RepID=A0A9N8VL80_9GLOM|nr:131_t:CDS:2 [Diversispora eburnea]
MTVNVKLILFKSLVIITLRSFCHGLIRDPRNNRTNLTVNWNPPYYNGRLYIR